MWLGFGKYHWYLSRFGSNLGTDLWCLVWQKLCTLLVLCCEEGLERSSWYCTFTQTILYHIPDCTEATGTSKTIGLPFYCFHLIWNWSDSQLFLRSKLADRWCLFMLSPMSPLLWVQCGMNESVKCWRSHTQMVAPSTGLLFVRLVNTYFTFPYPRTF